MFALAGGLLQVIYLVFAVGLALQMPQIDVGTHVDKARVSGLIALITLVFSLLFLVGQFQVHSRRLPRAVWLRLGAAGLDTLKRRHTRNRGSRPSWPTATPRPALQ